MKRIGDIYSDYDKLRLDIWNTIHEILKQFPNKLCTFSQPITFDNGVVEKIYIDNDNNIKIYDSTKDLNLSISNNDVTQNLSLLILIDYEFYDLSLKH